MPDRDNGGKRIGKLEVSDGIQDTKLDMLIKQSKSTHDMLVKVLPQIVRNEERISSNRSWIKAMWTVAVTSIIAAIKVIFFPSSGG